MFDRFYHNALSRLRSLHPSFYERVFSYRRVVKYIMAGGTAAAADLAILYALNEWFGFWYLAAAVIAFAVAFGVSFTLQKFWTFRDQSRERIHAQATAYFLVSVGNLIVNTIMIYVFVEYFHLYVIIAQIIAGILIAISSFFIYRHFIFNRNPESVAAVSSVAHPRRVGYSAALALITLALYLPFFFYFQSLAGQQITSGENPRFVLPVYGSDSEGYVRIADNVLFNHAFSEASVPPYAPDTFRTPGYPALLAGFKGVFGSYEFFPLLQIVFTAVSAVLIFKMGERLWSAAAAFSAAALFVMDPTTLFHSMILMSDITYVFLLLAAVYALFFSSWCSPVAIMSVGGVLLGLSTLVRPISMFLVVLLPLFLLWQKRRQWRVAHLSLAVVVFVGAYAAVVMPWVIRNKDVSGVWGISSVKDFNFYQYNVPEFLSYKYNITPDKARLILEGQIAPVTPAEAVDLRYSPALAKVWMNYVRQFPISFAAFYTVKTVPFFLSSSVKAFEVAYNAIVGNDVFIIPASNLTNILLHGHPHEFFLELRHYPVLTLEEIFWTCVLLLSLVPLVPKEGRFHAVLFLALVFYFALLTGVVAYPRFRLPAAPFLFLLASQGAVIVYHAVAKLIARSSVATR